MSRRLLVLNGLAILAVVVNHAAGWGFTAMIWWTDRYRPVTVPNYDQVGSLTYYLLLAAKQLTLFSVPAFLFVSGFFIAYATRGNTATLTWKTVRARLVKLLVPYAIWSAVIFIGDFLQGTTFSMMGYLERLLYGSATAAYFYVPIICQLYALSPWIASLARTRWQLLISVSAFVELVVLILPYLSFVKGPGIEQILGALCATDILFFQWIFYFVLGVVGGLYLPSFRQWLFRLRWTLLAAVIVMGMLAIIEPEGIYRLTARDWRGGVHTLATGLYATSFILCFLAFEQIALPFSKFLCQCGSKTYGIYLLHPKVLELVARVIYHVAPIILAYPFQFEPILVVLAVGLPLLVMAAVARSPARKAYSYLFG